jgi:2-polyprenyl-3-methyl-5-hydroxy-6-metoxy-1,4-benzoquinol methylase
MHQVATERLRDPSSQAKLTLRADVVEGDDVIKGVLEGPKGSFEIVDGIPRFCPKENYAESFGYQWQRYATTQLDSKAKWANVSERRLFDDTGWARDLKGQRILEAGSGMGRFTEILARTGADIWTFDYSRAVDANFKNNKRYGNVSFAQADIFSPPFELASFDKILCIGVLQHTPAPKRALQTLFKYLKPGGEIFIDIYRLEWKSFFKGKYYVRPITRLLPANVLHKLVDAHVSWLFPITGRLHKLIGPRAASLSWALAMADYRGVFEVDEETAREYAVLDTFDMLAPAFDRPATIGMVRRWFEEAKMLDVRVEPGSNGIIASGRRPK